MEMNSNYLWRYKVVPSQTTMMTLILFVDSVRWFLNRVPRPIWGERIVISSQHWNSTNSCGCGLFLVRHGSVPIDDNSRVPSSPNWCQVEHHRRTPWVTPLFMPVYLAMLKIEITKPVWLWRSIGGGWEWCSVEGGEETACIGYYWILHSMQNILVLSGVIE